MSKSRDAFNKMMAELESKNAEIYEEVADDVIANLGEDDIERIRLNPVAIDYHFGLCLYIRNKYIHSGEVELVGEPDHMSGEIMRVIIRKLLAEYDSHPLALALIDRDHALASIHRYAFSKPSLGVYLDALSDCCPKIEKAQEIEEANPPDYDWDNGMELLNKEAYEAAEEQSKALREAAISSIADTLWDFDGYSQLAKEAGVPDREWRECAAYCEGSLKEGWRDSIYIHSTIGLLPAFGDLDKETQEGALQDLGIFLDQWPREVLDKVPECIFKSRAVAEFALGKRRELLRKMPFWQRDRELVKTAVANQYSSIKYADKELQDDREILRTAFENASGGLLFDEPYSKFVDDDEFVWLAVTAYPSNLSWASERLRDTKELVLAAIDNSDNVGVVNFYDELSEQMRLDRDVVMAIAASQSIPYEFPPEQYRDDDEVGKLLADGSLHGDRYTLINMSRRIKEKWMTEDELERWGD